MHNTSHSTQFQALTKHLLLAFSSAGAIPRMPVQDIDHYSELAVFHDAGKKAIPPAILNKPGFLTPEEFSIMKSHTDRLPDCPLGPGGGAGGRFRRADSSPFL